jgi:hypothetical protein
MATLAIPRFDTATSDLPMNPTSPVLAKALLQTNDARGRWRRTRCFYFTGQPIDIIEIYLRFFETIRRLIFSYLFSKSGIYEMFP